MAVTEGHWLQQFPEHILPMIQLHSSRKNFPVTSLPGVIKIFCLGPVRTTRNFVCFAKKSVNAKQFLVRTIFCTHQNFCKRYETSKIPSTSFGGCENFVRRENPLFLDIHPSLGHQISQDMAHEANVTI